jgi:anaerobic magnesium-protoporphyrin IX monomethyl ester cyclase
MKSFDRITANIEKTPNRDHGDNYLKIVLISNPTSRRQKPDFPPLGIAYLGATAHQAGHEVLLMDGGLRTISQITRDVRNTSPDVVGVTCWTIDRGMVWKLCAALKEAVPKALLVLGGPHATMYPEHIFKKTHASAVIVGEGEETFAEFLDALTGSKNLKDVAGMVLRDEGTRAFYTAPRPQIQNIDSIPHPYYGGFQNFNLLNYGGFPTLPRPTAAVISSRGCVFDCHYCGSVRFWGRRWRYRSSENVLKEIGWLIVEMGVRSLYFFDDNFLVNKDRALAICKGIINNGWNLKWACCSHVKMVNRELLEVMRVSGCVTIDFGVESGSNKILKNVNKRQTGEEIKEAFDLVHNAGILPRAYLMVGCPGEDESTIDETVELIRRIKPRSSIGANLLWLLPGTAVYQDAVKNRYISEDFWLESDESPYNLQEHSMEELEKLRRRLLLGIARKKDGFSPRIAFYLKTAYYNYPFLSIFRSLVPGRFR